MPRKIVLRQAPQGYDQGDFPADMHPVLRRVYQNRGIYQFHWEDYQLKALLHYDQLKGCREAATLLADAVQQNKSIVIAGDLDCDGATSTALAVSVLKQMGAEKVHYIVPNRFTDGYGLTPEKVEQILPLQPDLIVTVDNGISSFDGVARAKALGMQVIITDHHLPAEELPAADVIVNPNLPDNPFPAKSTAGVGVIFYVLIALRAELKQRDWFAQRPLPNLADYLDLVALGTVADLVPLDHNNRILVYQGLQRIRRGQCRPGILALIQQANRNPQRLQASDFSYAIAPRLNAAGRLEDMRIGIECLLTTDFGQAMEYAYHLDSINQERKDIEGDIRQQAEKAMALLADDPPWGICLYHQDWHQGVIGIVASRLKHRYHRPTVVLAQGSEEGILVGSARSIPGIHIRDALEEIAVQAPGLLIKFGGHAMAAGLSLKKQDWQQFKDLFNQLMQQKLAGKNLDLIIESDGELQAQDFSYELAQQIADGGPWGQNFPEPVFHGYFRVLEKKLLQDKHWRMKLQPAGSHLSLSAIAFNLADEYDDLPEWVLIAYQLNLNEFRQNIELQLQVLDLSQADAESRI